MSVLESLRKRSGLLVGIVGLALLAFVLTGVFQSGNSMFGGQDNKVGEIAGKSIDYKEFKTKVDEAVENQKRSANKASLDPQEVDNIVQQVWNQKINELVLENEYKRLGIAVSDEELYDLMVDHPHSALLRNLSDPQTGKVAPMFADPKTGAVSPAKIREFTKNMTDEQEQQWAQLEKYIRQVRIAEKYNSLIKSGLYVTTAVAKYNYIAKNSTISVKYAMKNYNSIVDSTLKPTEAELNDYYKAHQNEFKQEASRTMEYVAFNIVPSDEDIKETKKEMGEIAADFKARKPEEDSIFVISQSASREFDMTFHTKGTLSPEIDSIMFKSDVGTVVGPYEEGGVLKIAKLEAVKNAADSAKVRHILIAYANSGASPDIKRSQEEAKKIADSLLVILKKSHDKFPEFVEKNSDDNGKKMPPNKKEGEYFPGKGGDYGWMNANSGFVEPFKNAGLDGKKGDLKLVESQFGYHIIEVLDVKGSQKKVQVAIIDKKIEPSSRTLQSIFVHASEFAGKNTSEELFQKAVAEDKTLSKRIADNVKENDRTIPGVESPRSLIKWLYENKKGTVSEPMEFGNKFIVAVVTDIKEKGIATMEQVKDDLTARVVKYKKGVQLAKEFETALAGNTSIDVVANKLNTPVQQADNVNFANNALPGLSDEPSLIGNICAQKPQTLGKAIVGNEGVFIAYVVSKTDAPAQKDYSAEQKTELGQIESRVDYEVYEALKDNANIKEHFIKFGL